MSKEIHMSEVKNHKQSGSAWIVIHNNVYDVTKFLGEHPGGEDSIMEWAGQDATIAFEDVGHSEDARELMTKFKIGTLHKRDRKTITSCSAPETRASSARLPKNTCVLPDIRPVAAATRRISCIRVPIERNLWKWALLALGVAVIAGFSYRKIKG